MVQGSRILSCPHLMEPRASQKDKIPAFLPMYHLLARCSEIMDSMFRQNGH